MVLWLLDGDHKQWLSDHHHGGGGAATVVGRYRTAIPFIFLLQAQIKMIMECPPEDLFRITDWILSVAHMESHPLLNAPIPKQIFPSF